MYVGVCQTHTHTYIHQHGSFSLALLHPSAYIHAKKIRESHTPGVVLCYFFLKTLVPFSDVCVCTAMDWYRPTKESESSSTSCKFAYIVLFYERGSTFNRIFRYGNLIHTVHGVSSHWLECHCCCCCFQYVHAPTSLRMWIFLRIDWQQEWARAKETESCTDLIENFTGIFLSGRLNTTMSFYDIHRIKQSTKRPNNECINGGLRLTRNHAHCCISVCVV